MLATARSTLIAMALLGVAACAPSTPTAGDTTADEAAIRAADLAHANAYYAGQVDTILLYYANDAVVMPPDAPAITAMKRSESFGWRVWPLRSRANRIPLEITRWQSPAMWVGPPAHSR
jgi:hypothetical protein